VYFSGQRRTKYRRHPTRVRRETGSLVHLCDSGQSLLQDPAAGRSQSAHVAVRLPVAAAHPVRRFALTRPLWRQPRRLSRAAATTPTTRGEPFALQALAAGRVVFAGAAVALAADAHQAAVAAVRHVAARTVGARALSDVTTGRALVGFGRRSGVVVHAKHQHEEKQLHRVFVVGGGKYIYIYIYTRAN